MTFGATEQVTNTKLHTLVDSATLSSITQTDLSAGLGLVSVGSSAPSDTDQLWVDTSLSPYVVKYYNGSAWVPDVEGQVLTNKSGQSLSAGHVTIIDTSNANSVTTTATAGSTLFGGVSVATVANNAAGVFKRYGYVPAISLEISASAGSFLRTSTASGKAEPLGAYGAGCFGVVSTQGTASAAGFIFGAPGGGVGATDNVTWTGNHTFNGSITLTTASATTTNWSPIVQFVSDSILTTASGTTNIALDNSIPQSSEGFQVLSAAITPKNSNNKLIFEAVVNTGQTTASTPIICLFQDSGANAIAVNSGSPCATNETGTLRLLHVMTAGTTASAAFKVRIGADAGTTFLNSNPVSSARLYGGVAVSTFTITEVKV